MRRSGTATPALALGGLAACGDRIVAFLQPQYNVEVPEYSYPVHYY